MGLGKAFGLGLIIFIGLNFLAMILSALLVDITQLTTLFTTAFTGGIQETMKFIAQLIGGPILTDITQLQPYLPVTAITSAGADNVALYIPAGLVLIAHVESIVAGGTGLTGPSLLTSVYDLLKAIALLVIWLMPFLITAILVGYFSGSPGNGFGAWFLIVFLGILIIGILDLITAILSATNMMSAIFALLAYLIWAIPGILVNAGFWGVIAAGGGYKWEE